MLIDKLRVFLYMCVELGFLGLILLDTGRVNRYEAVSFWGGCPVA